MSNVILAPIGGMEIAVILVIVLLLFGGKKIPELMRGLGRGVKEFKDGKEGVDSTSDPKTPENTGKNN